MSLLLIEKKDGVATLTLNRPDALNALNRALRKEVSLAFRELKKDDSIRCVVLTGSGRAFSAGVDLKEAGEKGFALGRDEASDLDLVAEMQSYEWPIIAAVNGFAITGGFEVVLAADIILASTEAKFADTHARVGIAPGWGLSQNLHRLIGLSRARELSFSGNFLDADTAERWGLVNRVYAPEELVPAAQKLALEIASCDPATLKLYKRVIEDGLSLPYAEALKHEAKLSAGHSANFDAETVEKNRQAVTARGRSQN